VKDGRTKAKGKPKAVVWSDDLRIGIDEVDREHQALFLYFNELLAAADRHADAPETSREAIAKLELMFREHFEHEEKLMLETGYPGYHGHKDRHDEFFSILRSFTAFQPEVGGFDGFFLSVFRNWILYHISVSDREIGLYLQRRNAAAPSDEP